MTSFKGDFDVAGSIMPGTLINFIWVVFLFLYGCSAQQLVLPTPKGLKLLPPAEGAIGVLLKQKVILESRGKRQQFLVVTRLEKHRLKLVVLSPVGQQLLSLDYDGKKLVQENSSSVNVPGKEILASMQFALWPERSIKSHYPENEGWLVEIGSEERTLLTSSGVLLKLYREAGELIVDNYLRDYRVIIHTLEEKKL